MLSKIFLAIFQLADDNPLTIAFFVLGGLGLFFYGMNIMSSSLKNLAGRRLKKLIQKTTNNAFKAMLVGLLITILTQSSSATSVIVIGLIGAGLMGFGEAVPVLLGANIGATITSFIIGLNLADYALPIIFIGVVLIVFISHKYTIKETGGIILGLGLLFLGLELMGTGLKVFEKMDFFSELITKLSDVKILGFAIGTVLTALIQSSSGFIGILQKLYEGGSLPLVLTIPLILGANVGTTITGLIASISANKQGKKTAVCNFIIKLFGALLFMALLPFVSNIIVSLNNLLFKDNINMLMLAIIHMIYNVVTTLIAFIFIKFIVKFINKLFPEKQVKSDISADYLNLDLLKTSPILALESARRSIIDMSKLTLDMINSASNYLTSDNDIHYKNCFNNEDKVDMYDHLIHDYLMQLHTETLSTDESIYQAIYLDTIRDFERIADHAVNLVEFLKDRYDQDIDMDEITFSNLSNYFTLICEQVADSTIAFEKQNADVAHRIMERENYIDTLERSYRQIQLTNINASKSILYDIHYVDILSNLERISDHCNNIAENVVDPYYMKKQ